VDLRDKKVVLISGARLISSHTAPRSHTIRNRIGSTVRAKTDLGFEAGIRLEEALQRLIGWRKAYKEEVAQRHARVAH
jgi:UDP-glucose 4-epimerase